MKISRIIQEDKRLIGNLRKTAKEYSKFKKERAKTAVKFYETFLKDYIFRSDDDKKEIARCLKEFFGKEKIRIVAIDGTKYLRSRRGCLAFYVLAAPLVYELDLDSSNPRPIRIEDETVKNNVMALVPIPFSEIFLIGEQRAEVGGEETEEFIDIFTSQKIGKIDSVLMKLAEVYTTYWCLKNIHPDAIMIDGSLFQDYSFSNRSVDRLTIHRGEVLGHDLSINDFRIFKSLPINSELEIPSRSFTRLFLIAELLKYNKIKFEKKDGRFSFRSQLIGEEVEITTRQLNNLEKLEYVKLSRKDDEVLVELKTGYERSWEKLKTLFLKVCEEGFDHNNLDAFKIYITEKDKKSYRYLCEEDVETLCRIGYNMIIEECWKTKTLLFSVTKDSFVRFFVDNFLTVAGPRHLKVFDFKEELLPMIPSTDAGMLYDISIRVNDLHPPIFLMEFDPAISTIYSWYDREKGVFVLSQLRRVAQERQFMRTLVQISEIPSSGRKSYVYTVDRITYPGIDQNFDELKVETNGTPYRFSYYTKPNQLTKVILGLMFLTSSNRHDAVFGYPDPLFEVDQYVKTIGRTHLETIDLALTEIDLDEFAVTYREMRERGGG